MYMYMYSCIACIYMYIHYTCTLMSRTKVCQKQPGQRLDQVILPVRPFARVTLSSCVYFLHAHHCTVNTHVPVQVTIKVHVYFNDSLWNARPNCEFDNYINTAGIDIYMYLVYMYMYVCVCSFCKHKFVINSDSCNHFQN